jgi:hypothetical protein
MSIESSPRIPVAKADTTPRAGGILDHAGILPFVTGAQWKRVPVENDDAPRSDDSAKR